jgi:hypothetical protein
MPLAFAEGDLDTGFAQDGGRLAKLAAEPRSIGRGRPKQFKQR